MVSPDIIKLKFYDNIKVPKIINHSHNVNLKVDFHISWLDNQPLSFLTRASKKTDTRLDPDQLYLLDAGGQYLLVSMKFNEQWIIFDSLRKCENHCR